MMAVPWSFSARATSLMMSRACRRHRVRTKATEPGRVCEPMSDIAGSHIRKHLVGSSTNRGTWGCPYDNVEAPIGNRVSARIL